MESRCFGGSSRGHGVCKGRLAAQQAGLHRTVFIIELGLYFGLGARLIIAYNAQGETRHHLTVAADSLPIGWDAIWALGREGRGVPSLPGGPGDQYAPRLQLIPQAPPQAGRGPGFSPSKMGLAMLLSAPRAFLLDFSTGSPPATPGSQRDREPHLTERVSEEETHAGRQNESFTRYLPNLCSSLGLSFPSWPLKASCWLKNHGILK